MKFSEAMKLLEDGRRVRGTSWPKDEYIVKVERGDGLIKDQDGNHACISHFHLSPDWEVIVEPDYKKRYISLRKEMDELMPIYLNRGALCDDLRREISKLKTQLNKRKRNKK